MKKLVALILALALTLGCAAAMADKVGYTCMDGTNPFFVALEAAIREVVEANGDELISLDPQNSNEKQIAQIEDMISNGVVAMFVNPVDKDGIIAGLDKLKEANIPMFGFDTEVADMSYLVTYAGSDKTWWPSCPTAAPSSCWILPQCSLLWTAPTASSKPLTARALKWSSRRTAWATRNRAT